MDEFLNEIIELIQPAQECKITYNSAVQSIRVNRPVLMHILINLVTNSFKYNHKEFCKTHVEVAENHKHYLFAVQDNGDGIPAEMQKKIFDIFTIGAIKDRYGRTGTGLGLASVKKFVEANGGEVKVSSAEGEGSMFEFMLLK
jgi:signal transduction histidine kinase